MPAIAADWEAVKALAIACGSLKDAAEAHGVPYSAAKMRASREQWPVGRRPAQQLQQAKAAVEQQAIRAGKGNVTSVTSASQAAEKLVQKLGKDTKIGLMRVTKRGVDSLERMDGEEIVAQAQNVKALAAVADTLHGYTAKSTAGAGVLVNVSLMTMLASDFAPAIEVTAEVTPLSRGDMAETGQNEGEE